MFYYKKSVETILAINRHRYCTVGEGERRRNHKRAGGFSYKRIELSFGHDGQGNGSTSPTSGIRPRLRQTNPPGRSDLRLPLTLNKRFRFLQSESLGCSPFSAPGPIVSRQSTEQANNENILGLTSPQQGCHSPSHDLRNLWHVRDAELDHEG